MVKEIKRAVTIPVMAKARIGHFVEAQILEACGIDYIDESEARWAEGPGGGRRCGTPTPHTLPPPARAGAHAR